jgi:hypothetical protein
MCHAPSSKEKSFSSLSNNTNRVPPPFVTYCDMHKSSYLNGAPPKVSSNFCTDRLIKGSAKPCTGTHGMSFLAGRVGNCGSTTFIVGVVTSQFLQIGLSFMQHKQVGSPLKNWMH